MQIVTSLLANRFMDFIYAIDLESGTSFNDRIIGDRVEIVNYAKDSKKFTSYVFDRFLPLEWKCLVDPLAIIFSYLPRSMECFLNEIFAKLDGVEESFNYVKPVKFDILNDDVKDIFKPAIIARGNKYYLDNKVVFYLRYYFHNQEDILHF